MFQNFTKTIRLLTKIHLETVSTSKRYAGHSKWQNIRHIKAAKDAQKSDTFTRLSRQLKLAAQEGGSVDPKLNIKLEQTVEQAKRFNMPASTINNILKQVQSSKENLKGHLLEIRGPGGCIVLCEVLTSHVHQLKQQMATILKKHSSRYTDGGGIHLFEEKGIIVTDVLSSEKDKKEEEIVEAATEHAIISGAEDVKFFDGMLEFTCGKSNLKKVVEALQNECKYTIESASVEYIPLKTASLTDEDLELYSKMYDKLEALPEVVKISDNIA